MQAGDATMLWAQIDRQAHQKFDDVSAAVFAGPVETRSQLRVRGAARNDARSVDELPHCVQAADPARAFEIDSRAA